MNMDRRPGSILWALLRAGDRLVSGIPEAEVVRLFKVDLLGAERIFYNPMFWRCFRDRIAVVHRKYSVPK